MHTNKNGKIAENYIGFGTEGAKKPLLEALKCITTKNK
jgi:hypothetical protein